MHASVSRKQIGEDKMATDWSNIVEILSAIPHGSPHEAVPELCKAINNGSCDIVNCEDDYEQFFSSVVVLSAHFIGLNISSCTDCLHHAIGACKVLLQFCLERIKKERDKFLSKKNLVSVIEGLCKGHGCLDRTELTMFIDGIKQAKYPKNEETTSSVETTKTEFYGKLTRQGLLNTNQSFARLPFARYRMFGFEDDDMIDIKTYLCNANVSFLREKQGGQVLLDLCVSLPHMSKFMTLRGMKEGKPSLKMIDNLCLENMLTFHISRVQELTSEMTLINSIASIPVMEPLNSSRLNKIMWLTLACVDIATYAACGYLATTAIDDVDEIAKKVVDTSLSVVDMISHTLSTSHRAGGHIVQNFNLLVTHCILKGLMPLLKNREINEDKASETKWEGFNMLRMELSKKVIGILSSLLEDLKMESNDDEYGADVTADDMNIEVHVSAWCRVKLLFHHFQLVPLLMRIFMRSYYKADYLSETLLKGEDEAKSTSNEAETKSNNSNEDSSEGETLFGGLFESQGGEQENVPGDNVAPSWRHDEGKLAVAESYLEMAKTVLVFISDYMFNNISPNLMANIRQTFPTAHLADLATLVLELDGAKTHIGRLSPCYSFNQCLDRYLHILLTFGVLTDGQQETLLKQLGISPYTSEHWPLYIGPRSLSVLARVLLGRQELCRQSERDDESCGKVWQRLILTLREMAFNERRRPDLNVEQLQLLLLVWHNFSKKQRDKILVMCVNALCAISQEQDLSDRVPLYCMRLLTILDYMLYQYNEPPRELLTQVQYNLFKTKSSYMAMLHMDDEMMDEPRLLFFLTVEREDREYYRPTGDPLGHTYEKRTPRFYGVRCGDESELPDGMFRHLLLILDEESMSYSHLYTSLTTLLTAGSRCDILKRQKSKFVNLSDAKIVRCLFGMCWRLLLSLPPPISFFSRLQRNQTHELKTVQDFVTTLMTLHWSVKITKLSNTDDHSAIKNILEAEDVPADDAVPLATEIVTTACDHIQTVKHASTHLQQILDHFTHKEEVLNQEHLPGLFTLMTVDCILARVAVVFTPELHMTEELKNEIEKLFAVVLLLVKAYQGFARFSLLSHHNVFNKIRDQDVGIYSKVIRISSSAMAKNPLLAGPVVTGLPIPVEEIKQWNNLGSVDFNPLFSPEDIINESISDPTQTINMLLSSHLKVMSFRFPFSVDASIRHVMKSLVQLIATLLNKCAKEEESLHFVFAKEISRAITPLVVDASAEFLLDEIENIVETAFGSLENEECLNQIQNYLLENCYDLIIQHSVSHEPVLCEEIFVDCERFMESLLERAEGRSTLQNFFDDNDRFVRLFLLSANQNFSLSFVYRMLKFVSRTLETYEKQPSDLTAVALVQSISKISEVDPALLATWLNRIIVGSLTDKEMTGKMADNRLLLQSIVSFLVKEQSPVSSSAIETLLDAIIPLGTLLLDMTSDVSVVIGSKFVDFLSISSTLAGYSDGSGHIKLMKAVVVWLQTCKGNLKPDLIGESKAKDNTNSLVECTNVLLAHVADVLVVLKQTDDDEMSSGCHGDEHIVSDVESEGADDDDDSGAEESEEEVDQLWNKLCTFTATRKEFANQHWYHCHTCRMNDGVGVCTVCAKVCHKNHDVTYAKYGSFFCDCGAKEDDSCKAMKKRHPHDISDMASPDEKISTVSSYRRPLRAEARSSVSNEAKEEDKSKEKSSYEFGQPTFRRDLRKQIEANKKSLVKVITDNDVCETLLALLSTLSRISNPGNYIVGGARQRITEALDDLHSREKNVENNEQLLVATSGSQEGAFENVKLVCNGEQGQAIRQLLGTHVLRRVAMCCLTSAKGRRQHLAVSHEKGKITILQLSSLLKQADSSRRKLTITRLATTQVPFTILSLTGNICNEDFLAVSGLKDCHVLTLSSSGSVVNHLVLHPQLETGNYIIKTIWLPRSQTELAVVTADFVQIYDLCKDALSPVYYFVLPAGKIRDVTFIFQSSLRHMCLISSEGLIYIQQLDESSSAKSGPFYLTNIVPVDEAELPSNNGQVGGGGVSVYYSHGLQLLFFSYVEGKTFVAPWTENLPRITGVFPINVKPANGNKTAPSTLWQWSEVLQHPGLVFCATHTAGIPIVLMVKPDNISYQEIKPASSKSKIQDVVAIRHSLSNSDQSRTTVILLCEDGSLKIFMASQEQAGFWMSPAFQPTSAVAALKPIKPRKLKKNVRIKTSSSPHFPIDFFEHCQVLNDVEFGGKDFLQVYNVQQVKHRLMTAGMYIACTKPNSFSITITNCNPAVVMVGVRVLVGCQAIDKAPTFVEVFGRAVDVEIKRNRWFDIPFAREEVLSSDRTITLTFGQSHDASNVTMIDSIKVYCKSKEVFGWPDDLQDEGIPPSTPTPTTVPPVSPFTQNSEMLTNTAPLSLREIMTANSLRALDGFVSLVTADEESTYQGIVTIATSLLSSALPQQVQEQVKILLASLHPTKMTYNNHKDHAQLTYVVESLYKKKSSQDEVDPEVFERLVVMTRAVAVSRPENLVKFTNELTGSFDPVEVPFPMKIVSMFWQFYQTQPSNSSLVTGAHSGMHYAEMIIFALVEILHAFIVTDSSCVPMITELYVQLLLCQDTRVSFACKQALAFVLRPSSRRAPTKAEENKNTEPNTTEQASQGQNDDQVDGTRQAAESGAEGGEQNPEVGEQGVESGAEGGERSGEGGEDEYNITPPWELNQEEEVPVPDLPEPGVSSEGRGQSSAGGNRLEALLNAGFPSVYELPPDADDEAMMELAIALSLQEQGEEAALGLHHLLGEAIENGGPVDEGEGSSSSASGHASEDELEPTTGSMDLAQMQAEASAQQSSQDLGSVSEGSAESLSGENPGDEQDRQEDAMESESGVGATPKPDDQTDRFNMSKYDDDVREKLHNLNLVILRTFIEHFHRLNGISGVQAIPFMQVLLMLCFDLDNNDSESTALLHQVFMKCLEELHLDTADITDIATRSSPREVQLIVMRFLSVIMSRSKSGGKSSTQTSSMSTQVATSLFENNIMDHCLAILNRLMEHWQAREKTGESEENMVTLLKPQPGHSPPDMSPFFLKQYVKSHASDLFEAYPLLVTEMVLRLTYQVKKIADGSGEDSEMKDLSEDWFTCLFEYMMIQQSSFVKIKRQVRKLLLFLCGSKENYREQRDSHALAVHFRAVRRTCDESGFTEEEQTPMNIEYDTLLDLIEHLKAAADIASNRTKNWQAYCLKNKSTLSFLFKVSFIINEGVTATILQLLTTALCENDSQKDSESSGSVHQELVLQLTQSVDIQAVRQFVRCFLLQSNSTSIRWQAHSLLYSIHRNCESSQQDKLSDMMWSVWPELPAFGRKAAQFVDLLGYFTIKCSLTDEKAAEFSEKAIALLKKQNEILRNHANSNVYRLLSGLVDFDGFYLESDPCLVCNNPEVPYNNSKLSAIKADARFSTTSHMVKLVGSHNISKITLRVTDVKRQKMVKTINLYYNNRSVQSVVELKNKTAIWQKAKKCHLIQGQTEVKIEFPLPIVACNLMIEYADFYENLQASSETLQCPRCSAPVPANPGVCGNCGENVYQCHKCRSINYDEKDPFLCNACGFCKYAKFDVTLTAKPCCAVDPIENEEDRKKAVTSINTLLDRADKMYRQLVAHRQPLDSLLMKIAEQGDNDFIKTETSHVTASSGSSNAGSQAVNKSIQAVAQRYCVDCKGNFDELSKITQKVLASRKELIEYDTRVRDKITSSESKQRRAPAKQLSTVSDAQSVPGRCYGCSSAATEHCVTLLKALAIKTSTRDKLIKEGLIIELVNFTLYQGTCSIRNNVRDLLCLLTRNNVKAAEELNTILVNRVTKGMKEQSINPSVSSSISRDMQLLTRTVELEDTCWEQRLRCVTQIFLLSVQHVSPIVVQAVTLPCLKILSQFIKPKPATTKANANKNIKEMASVKASAAPIANMKDWIESEPDASYEEWERRTTEKPGASEPRLANTNDESADDLNEEWLRNVMFSPSCGALRQVACSIVETVCQIPGRKRKIMDLLTSYLQGVGEAGENAAEFFNLYSELMKSSAWKGHLASNGALLTIKDLITKEIEQLTVLEETTLSSDLSQGYSLKRLTELMASFVEDKKIKQDFKRKLVGAVLNGYLSLRRLVVQRTKLVDQSQEILLNLLGELTSGTESETKDFMAICVDTLNRYEVDDLRTPVFIFERLCNIIYPEENDTSEFLLMLEKDPQQEDFLQGRMQGNPYKSSDTGMGPLMRDVKNKICTDCDLIALLEDDTGMELLVNSKIISLDLPVKEVYKKIWCPQGEGEPMKVVYRMRGLLGDATEDIVEHLDENNQKGVDNEVVYKMANVMSECGGLEAILKRLSGLRDLVRGRQLLEVILKLLGFCVKVKANRDYLAKPSLKTLKILLDVLNQILNVEQGTPSGSMAEQILSIIEALLQGGGATIKLMIAAGQEEESQLEMLLEIIKTPYVRSNSNVLLSLMHILPFLTFGNKKSMNALIDHFEPYLNFEKFDKTHSDDELLFLECFCNIADGIENDENGNQLKNIIIDKGLVQQAVHYLELYTPAQAFSTSNLSDTDLWKEFLARPSLPFILKFLSGMCKGHERSQLTVSETAVPTIHRLEQVSSEEKVGSLAENLMEALKEHPEVKTKVTAVRRETRLEKKKLAMAMRLKQLGALGMSATESGKIITKPSAVIQGFEEISNETGLTCCICREGYKYHPNKVLGIYTYTKRCILDNFESKQRKTQGYSTVSHFNIVHYECHVAAIRLARGRDEWESAALQNSNTKCNGLLPIWGPQVPESSFASCLARHNNYIQEATSHIEPTFHNTVHDLRLLLERFAFEKSFNEDSGGGGRQSNFNIIPYMVHMALYVMNTARIRSLEKSVTTFVEEGHTSWIQSSFEVNGPLFMAVLSLFTHSLEEWKKTRLIFLNRLLTLAHVREVSPKGATKLSDGEVKPYNVYRPILIFFALVNKLQHMLKEHISSTSSWSQDVASFIRNNDEKILKSCEELLNFYQDDLLPASSFSEYCDVADLHVEIPDPEKFMKEVLTALPK